MLVESGAHVGSVDVADEGIEGSVSEPDMPQGVDIMIPAAAMEAQQEPPAEPDGVHAEGAGDQDAGQAVPWDMLFPRRNNSRDEFRDVIVKYVLPDLLLLLRDPQKRLMSQRTLVGLALDKCVESGNKFWGAYATDTRKRSVCDAVLAHYIGTLQDYALGRPVAI